MDEENDDKQTPLSLGSFLWTFAVKMLLQYNAKVESIKTTRQHLNSQFYMKTLPKFCEDTKGDPGGSSIYKKFKRMTLSTSSCSFDNKQVADGML